MLPMPLARSLRDAGPHPALVLNADYRPLNAFPLSLWNWPDAAHAVLSDRVIVVNEYDRVIRSQKLEMRLPSVVALKTFVPVTHDVAFTRFNVYLRDQFCCAYCGVQFQTKGLTFDHVIPKSRGGRTSWMNIVAACHACNGLKANRTPEEAGMPLQWRPWKPSSTDLAAVGYRFRQEHLHEHWRDFLYWDSELEST